jgi:hypothetical protein
MSVVTVVMSPKSSKLNAWPRYALNARLIKFEVTEAATIADEAENMYERTFFTFIRFRGKYLPAHLPIAQVIYQDEVRVRSLPSSEASRQPRRELATQRRSWRANK